MFEDGAFLGAFEDLAPAAAASSSSFGDGAWLGGFEDLASPSLYDSTYLGMLGGDNGLSGLEQYFLSSQQIPEVSAGGADLGDWSTALGLSGDTQTGGFNAAKDSQQANEMLGLKAGSEDGFLQQVMKGMGLRGKDGSVNLSDPKQLQAWMRLLMAGGGVLASIMNRKSMNQKSPHDLLNSQGGGTKSMGWTPQQQATANGFFNAPVTPWNQRSMQHADAGTPGLVVQTPKFAHGGSAYADGGGPSHQLAQMGDLGQEDVPQGALNQVAGGQDDVIDARLAPGEYVFDADTVSAIGDGHNDAGAAKLDKFRENIRKHKRSAPPNKIPPRAKPLHQYMPKGAK